MIRDVEMGLVETGEWGVVGRGMLGTVLNVGDSSHPRGVDAEDRHVAFCSSANGGCGGCFTEVLSTLWQILTTHFASAPVGTCARCTSTTPSLFCEHVCCFVSL
ncbi:hypothetical protein VTH06DRAFT_6158 [Thermothelomyces fergusii]